MVVKKVSGGYAIFSKDGKKLSKVYKSRDEAIKRLRQIEYFKHAKESEKMELKYSVPITECEKIEEGEGVGIKARVGGVCLVPTVSRNGRKFNINNIKENDGKEVKFFVQEHGDLELKNVVGKMTLTESDGMLKYDGIIRNTASHPDIVEHALNKEIDVSIDARGYGRKAVAGTGVFEYDKVDIRAMCGVGVGGLPQNSMEYAIAESFNGVENEQQVQESEEKKLEVKKMDEVEQLKTQLAEKEKIIKEQEEAMEQKEEEEKKKTVEEIKKVNEEANESELMKKPVSELKLILEYEKKLSIKEQEEETKEEEEGNGEVEGEEKEENEVSEKEDIIVDEKNDIITLSEKGYKKFQEDLKKQVYN